MSLSLLRKSIAIVEKNQDCDRKLKENKSDKKKRGIHKHNRARPREAVRDSVPKKTIEDIRSELASNQNLADENIKKLLTISKHAVKIPNAEKIIQRAHNGKYVIVVEEQNNEPESCFTEADFAEFAKDLERKNRL